MIRYLLDTNIISDPTKPLPNPGILRRLQADEARCALAAPVWHELVYGCNNLAPGRKRQMIEDYLQQHVGRTFPILPYDQPAAQWHARERARLMALGRTPPFADGQIAAIAQVNNLILVTANGPDFQGFDGLQLEDWRADA